MEDIRPTPTKQEIYDELCNVQTRVEDGHYDNAYEALQETMETLRWIQEHWETVITADN